MENTVLLALIGLSAIVVAISLHEMMHAVAGYFLGDDTAKEHGRITLNPLAHIDPLTTVLMPLALLLVGLPPIGAAKPVPFNPRRLRWGEYGMALVALAGPLTNLILAIWGGLMYQLVGGIELAELFFEVFTRINIAFFVLNMIPIPPLDGSRVLYVFATDGLRDIMNAMERFGVYIIIILFISTQRYIAPFFQWANDLIFDLFA